MSVHAMTLTSYDKKRVQDCSRAVQVVNDVTRYTDLKMLNVPDPPLTMMPKIPTILFPADELPRPAVIGLGGSHGSYLDSATAIKEILASVLNIPNIIKSTLPSNADLQDSDVEDCNTGVVNDGEPACIPLIPCAQNDIRIYRHKAAWENPQPNSPKTFAGEPLASSPRVAITSTQSVTDLEMSPCLKCNTCTEVLLSGSTGVSQLNSPLISQKENRRFSTPNLSNRNLNPNPHDPPSELFTFPLNATIMDTEASNVEDGNTFHRRSQSYSNLPEAGQSLTSSTETLHHSRENLFEPAVNLEKENEHFLAADLFISLVEKMKSSLQYEQWRTEGGMQWIKRNPEEPCFHRKKAHSESATSVDSGYEGLAALHNSPAETIYEEKDEEESKRFLDYRIYEYEDYVVIDLDEEKLCMANQSSDTPERPNPAPGSNSAEKTARNLYRALRQQWLPADEVWLPATVTITNLSSKNAMPDEFESSVCLVKEIKRFKMMETEDWCSPRFEIISTMHPYMKRDAIVESQNYLCAGCGTKVELRYTNRLRYCDYLGKYFCDCCHNYSESSIPGRIFSKWNFSKYYVSNFSKNVLDKIWESHKFNVQSENPALYKKVKDLSRASEVQQQLIHIKKLVTTCRHADSVLKAFEEVPSHLTQELHLFTLSDLNQVKQKTLLPALRELLATAVGHVDTCELCQAKGFICEFCQSADVIFPFQIELCRRCEDCKACYHKQCFKTSDCPRCVRIKAWEALETDSPFTSSGEMDSNSTP